MTRSRHSLLLPAVLLATISLCLACGRAADTGASIANTELAERISDGTAPVILDVRSEEEYQAGHIPGSINVPYDQLAARLPELDIPKTDEVVVHCEGGRRAAAAEEVLVGSGYTHVLDLAGHMKGWRDADLPTE